MLMRKRCRHKIRIKISTNSTESQYRRSINPSCSAYNFSVLRNDAPPSPIKMLKGWFDAFRSNGGPTLYSDSNRTPVTEDIRNVLIYISFGTLFVAFLIVFPGIRKERLSTFISVTISLFVGAVILVCNYGTYWHVAEASISSPYRSFSTEKIEASIGVHVGLNSVNVTLQALPNFKKGKGIDYNERFTWIGPTQLKYEYRQALVKGLPFPILTIADYLSQDLEGFYWGRQYRMAGYYCSIVLWTAFALWLLMNVLLCAVPRYGAYTMQITGWLMLLSNALYAALLPRKPLVIPFEGGSLTFSYGWCFWLVLAAGIVAVITGVTVTVLDMMFPNKFSTILEVDYDTPYRYFVGQDATPRDKNGIQATPTPDPKTQAATAMVGGQSPQEEPSTSKAGIDNEAFEDDLNDGSTIIDGKRAVSLHHFGKFAQKELPSRGRGPMSAMHRRLSTGFMGSSKQDTSIDMTMQSAAMW